MTPATPSRSSFGSPTTYSHIPLRSSPLASPGSSPAASASARRRSQYKSTPFSSSAPQRVRESEAQRRRSSGHGHGEGSSSGAVPTEEAPRKAFLKERLTARVIERAAKKRERAVQRGSRHLSSDARSDGADEMMDEDDEDEDTMLNDELFRRIVESAKRKQRHAYRLSYADDVGSSFDPDMEDPHSWEEDMEESQGSKTTYVSPDDLLDEELEAYAAEIDLNLDDLPIDEIFGHSDYEDDTLPADQDVDMH
ncbi:uncharacterized protein TRAVEDRAFT_59907 [Trametes versicolor FP-101664 SS1]|uniref:uncharacterized protein n=1 Tax=Trametes versicolor (strain FP-101664) TaxID=717944 RepID=UPI0004623186|nr:uncharacterized protein TRAVEDRAFT_59907 [Trametes versicolor FP-101664 SS1]EIW55638.1 hypothetical protein TRAVEDRAFT_59907 [Trametes versicolor FP-101664 SS1]